MELFYRNLKQTFGRRKLRSASPRPALTEMHWSYLGLCAASAYALTQLLRDGVEPRRLSCAGLLVGFRRVMRDYLHPVERGHSLCDLLRRAVVDDYRRRGSKSSRDYPRKKRESPPGPPRIFDATAEQIQAAKALATIYRQRLTA